ncbi:unnamed protein product, partial [Brassica oleracea]
RYYQSNQHHFFFLELICYKNKIDLEKNLKLKCYWRNSCVDSVILEDSVAGREFIIRILSRYIEESRR